MFAWQKHLYACAVKHAQACPCLDVGAGLEANKTDFLGRAGPDGQVGELTAVDADRTVMFAATKLHPLGLNPIDASGKVAEQPMIQRSYALLDEVRILSA